jgi:hypothetical protein
VPRPLKYDEFPQEVRGVRVGRPVGRWEVLSIGWSKTSPRYRVALVRCTCRARTQKVVALGSLIRRTSKSCGCLAQEVAAESGRKGGLAKATIVRDFAVYLHPMYNTWNGLRWRCAKLGTGLHEPWTKDVVSFITWVGANLGPRPDNAILTRIDGTGPYAPGNLKWLIVKRRGQ